MGAGQTGLGRGAGLGQAGQGLWTALGDRHGRIYITLQLTPGQSGLKTVVLICFDRAADWRDKRGVELYSTNYYAGRLDNRW